MPDEPAPMTATEGRAGTTGSWGTVGQAGTAGWRCEAKPGVTTASPGRLRGRSDGVGPGHHPLQRPGGEGEVVLGDAAGALDVPGDHRLDQGGVLG